MRRQGIYAPSSEVVVSAQIVDPYPLMTVEYAVAALRARFGGENVARDESEATVTVTVRQPGGNAPTPLALTMVQAKYLAAHPISHEDLTNQRYPVDWPQGRGRAKRLPLGRPIHGGAVPMPFGPVSTKDPT